MRTKKWTKADSKAAYAEGWNLFDTGSELQLQRIDLPDDGAKEPAFPSDAAAWLHVVGNMLDGDDLAAKALAVLERESPDEWVRVTTGKGREVK